MKYIYLLKQYEFRWYFLITIRISPDKHFHLFDEYLLLHGHFLKP